MSRPLVWMSLLLLAAGCKNMQHPRNDPFLGNQLTPPPATGAAGEITPSKQYYEQGRSAQPPGGFGFRGETGGAEAKNAADAGLNFRTPSGSYGREVSSREGDAVAPTSRSEPAAAAKSATPMWLNEGEANAPASGGASSLPLKSTNPGDNPLRQTAPSSSRYGEEPDQSSHGVDRNAMDEDAETDNAEASVAANPRYQTASATEESVPVQPASYRSNVLGGDEFAVGGAAPPQYPDASHLFRPARKRSLKPPAEEQAAGPAEADRFGRDESFRSVHGRLEYSDDQGWRLRYAPHGDGQFDGAVLLSGGDDLEDLADGDFVVAHGVLDRRENWLRESEPTFLVERLERVR